MMGSENQGTEGAHVYALKEEMETLLLDDSVSSNKSYCNYRSSMTSLSDSHILSPPIIATPAESDPLLCPPRPGTPNSGHDSYLEPPSYNDAAFSPLHEETRIETDGNESPGRETTEYFSFSRSSSLSSSSEYLKISVSNPQTEAAISNSIIPGGSTFVTYLITTRTNLPEFGGPEFAVRRRFRDVVTLSDRLEEGYRGFFIPPRPDKSVVESQVMQKQEFVEQRRVALEKYLRRLAAHPVIKNSDKLRAFLQAEGKLPLPVSTDVASRMLDGVVNLPKQLLGDSSGMIEPQDVVQPAKGGRDLLRMFKELKQSVTNDWGGSKQPVEEEDKEFLDKKERLRYIEQQISSTSQQAESLVRSQQHMAETEGELGLALLKLMKFENQNSVLDTQRVRAADMKNLATVTVKASRLHRELNAQTVKHLDTLHEYLGLMLAVNAAFSDRSSALLTIQTLMSELSLLHSKADKHEAASSKIFGNDKSKVQKVEELRERIRVTENAKGCAIREYERIKENNRSEIERLDGERKDDYMNMIKGFVINQVAYTEKIAKEWDKVVEDTSKYVRESFEM